MHDGILTHLEDARVFLMMALFIATFQGQYIVNNSLLVLLSGLASLFFLQGWTVWEFYLVLIVALLLGRYQHFKRSTTWRKCNKVELAYFLFGQPFVLLFLSPLVIPQTNVAVGVFLAAMVYLLVLFFFSIFYVKNVRLLDHHIMIPIAAYWLLTLFFHQVRWLGFGVGVGLAIFC
jgi:hypothetical protein